MSRTATRSVTVIPPTINPLTHAPYREAMTQMVRTVLALPYEDVWIRSDDGLRLHGKYYAGRPGAPVQIMMHGYKSSTERDFCGGAQIAVQGGYHVLLVDQRAHGKSEGRCLTFGIQERYDCRAWVNYAVGALRRGHGCAGALRHSCAADSWRGRPLRPLRHGARKLCALRSAQQAAAGRAGRGTWAELHGGQGSVSGRAGVVPPVRAGLTLHTGKNQPHRDTTVRLMVCQSLDMSCRSISPCSCSKSRMRFGCWVPVHTHVHGKC